METTQRKSIAKQADHIDVFENPEGVFVARLHGRPEWSAEGSTAAEAQQTLLDLLDAQQEANAGHPRLDIVGDPDDAVLVEED